MHVQFKHLLFSIFLILVCSQFIHAQESSKLYINTENFKIKQGSEIYIKGSLEVDSSGNIDNGGNITLSDSLINSADGLFMPSSYGKMDNENNLISILNIGHVTFVSDSNQFVINNEVVIFDSINIAVGDSLFLMDSLNMVGQVEFINGMLDLNGNGLILYYEKPGSDSRNYGTLGTERNDSRIIDSSGTGFVYALKNLINGGEEKLNSIGLAPDDNIGLTGIKRYHYFDSLVTDTSIAKVFEICGMSASKGISYETGVKYLDNADLHSGIEEENLVIWNYMLTNTENLPEYIPHTSFSNLHPSIYVLMDEDQYADAALDSVRGKVKYSNGYKFTLAEKNCENLPTVNLGDDTVFCSGTTAKLKAFTNTLNWGDYLYSWGSDGNIGSSIDNANVYEYSLNTDSVEVETSFKLWVKVRDYKGCSASDTINVIVHQSSSVGLKIYEEDMTPTLFSICQGESFIIQDTNNTEPTIERYTWWFEDDTLSTHTYSVSNSLHIPGDTIKFGVKYTNEYGCVSYKTSNITVNPLPELSITADKPRCQGSYTQLNNLSTIAPKNPASSITLYRWTMDDTDSIDVVQNLITASAGADYLSEELSISNLSPDLHYRFTTYGEHQIKLHAISSANCVSTDSIEIYVNPAVTASFTPDELSSVCAGSASELAPDSLCTQVSPANYSWQVNPNLPRIFNDTVNHNFGSAGSYSVSLAVTSDSACTDTITKQVTIHPMVVADFTVNNHCYDSTAFFTNKTTSADSYQWDFGNGVTSTAFEESLKYDSAGTYQVKLIANNTWNCIDSIVKPLTIYPLPEVSFEVTSVICINEQSNTLNNTSESGINYYWTFGDGTFSNLKNPEKQYSTNGSYGINLVGTDTYGCMSSHSEAIAVYDLVTADYSAATASVCMGTASEFNPISSLFDLDSVKWVFGDGNEIELSKTAPSTSYVYGNSGFYIASLITLSSQGCRDTISREVAVYPNPDISIVNEGQNCESSEIVYRLNDNVDLSEITHYAWNFGDAGFSSIPTPGHFYDNTGNYSVSVEVITQQSCYGYDTIALAIEALPEIAFGDTYSTCESSLELIAGSPNYTYLWHDGTTDSSILVSENSFNSVTVTNPITGCSNFKETEVKLQSSVDPNLGDSIEACDFKNLEVFYSGGTYEWSTGEITSSILVTTTGEYTVKVTDKSLCEGYDTVYVQINSAPEITLLPELNFCEDETALLEAGTTSGTFEWSTTETSNAIAVTEPGYYWVKNTNPSGCSDQKLTRVSFNPQPEVNLGNNTSLCEDIDVLLNAGNTGSTYAWSTSETSQTISPSQSGEYAVLVTNTYGCSNSDTVIISINPLPEVDLEGNQSFCDGQELILDAGAAQSWYWSTYETSQSISIQRGGDYWVRVSDANGCSQMSDIIEVSLREKPVAPFASEYMEACSYALIDAQNVGSTYLWQDGETGRNYYTEESGQLWVEITNAQSCSIRDSVEVYVKPTANLDMPDYIEVCSNSHDFIDAGYFGEAYSYTWNTGSDEQYIKVSSPGWYKVKVTHEQGCVAEDSCRVLSLAAPEIDLPYEALMCANSGLILDAGNPGSLYSWHNSLGESYSEQAWEITQAASYWVHVMAENGCSSSDTTEMIATNMSIYPHFMVASNIRIGDTLRFVDLSMPDPETWYWEFGNLISSYEQEPTHIYYAENTYTATLTVSNEMCTASVSKPLTVEGYNPYYLAKMGTDQQEDISGLIRILEASVYPNPARDEVTLKFSITESAGVVYYLYNINGQIIEYRNFGDVEEMEHSINISGFSQGMYFVRLITRNEAKTFKLLKVN